ncbi:hypothetical protein ABT116_36465 [Streptomyces sp. NPDC002130]|uniref:hypothetical protein n=1 Tax=Streptomyces sp. NPDC002130 TaxID=3155568 RepID=UPI003324CC10
MLSTLAVAAGVAIDNARLYEETRLRERWLGASSEVTRRSSPRRVMTPVVCSGGGVDLPGVSGMVRGKPAGGALR